MSDMTLQGQLCAGVPHDEYNRLVKKLYSFGLSVLTFLTKHIHIAGFHMTPGGRQHSHGIPRRQGLGALAS